MKTTIKPELIATGEPQKITADLQPFSKAKEQVGLTVAELNRFVTVSTKEQLADAMEVLSIASKVEKAIEKKRKELVEPFNGGAKAINDHAKEITSGLPAAILTVKNAVLRFQREEEERALELKKQARIKQLEGMGMQLDGGRYINGGVILPDWTLDYTDKSWVAVVEGLVEELQEQEAEKLQLLKEEDEDLFDLLGLDDVPTKPVETLPAPSSKFFEPAKLNGAAKVWKFTIEDESLVPREFLIVNETAIRRAIAEGKREIAGVKIFQEDTLRIR